MKLRILAGIALASSLLAPAFSAPAPSAMKPFEAGALRVETTGAKGPAVILIPGLASGAWAWRDTAPRLAKDHVVYLVTLPGFDGRAPQAGATLESLQADLLEVATEGERHWASVHFSGTIRDTPGAAPAGFEEVWNLVKPADGSSGWLLAGIQQMH
jgi:pimeloyl-ACP methyl ester carboxylesterase